MSKQESTEMATVTVANQAEADARIPGALANGPCHLRIEGMEGPIDVGRCVNTAPMNQHLSNPESMLWPISVTVSGGDSPIHPDWVRLIRIQCQAAGVPFILESWGEWGLSGTPGTHRRILMEVDGRWSHWNPPAGVGRHSRKGLVTLYRVGRERSGRMLDGVKHDGETGRTVGDE